jgi:mRNA interferase RelE/StbE
MGPGYRVVIRTAAARVIRHLPPGLKRAVRGASDSLSRNPSLGEPLHGELTGRFKLRVRRYRIIYRLDRAKRILNVLAVGHRRSVYEEFAEAARSKNAD